MKEIRGLSEAVRQRTALAPTTEAAGPGRIVVVDIVMSPSVWLARETNSGGDGEPLCFVLHAAEWMSPDARPVRHVVDDSLMHGLSTAW